MGGSKGDAKDLDSLQEARKLYSFMDNPNTINSNTGNTNTANTNTGGAPLHPPFDFERNSNLEVEKKGSNLSLTLKKDSSANLGNIVEPANYYDATDLIDKHIRIEAKINF